MPQRRSVLSALLCVVLFLLAIPSLSQAREVVVELKNGSEVRGDMVGDNPEGVTLMISGIRREIARADIAQVRQVVTPADEFRNRRSEIKNDDFAARLELATWGYDKGLYDQTLGELRSLAKAMPEDDVSYRRVQLLIRVVGDKLEEQRQREAERNRPTTPRQPDRQPVRPDVDAGGDDGPRGPARAGRAEETDMLTDEQINLINVYEIDLSERPAIVVPPETVEKLFDQYKTEPALKPFMNRRGQGIFRGLQGWQQLDVMFQAGARNLYDQVNVTQPPPAMLTWMRSIHRTYVLNYCGTAECHGGEDGKGFPLFLGRTSDRRVAYTNFYILNQAKTVRGLGIDRRNPGESLLIQYGMPREIAEYPHPVVEDGSWQPFFRAPVTSDRNYQAMVDWMTNQLYRPAPNYGINYTAPERKPAAPEAPAEGDGNG